MLEGYKAGSPGESNRAEAVKAALEIIKAAISTPTDSKNVDYELSQVREHITPLADAILAAINKS